MCSARFLGWTTASPGRKPSAAATELGAVLTQAAQRVRARRGILAITPDAGIWEFRGRKRIECVHDFVEVLIGNLGSTLRCFVKSAHFRQRLAAADLAGEAPPTQRTPHQSAYAFGKRLRHQPPLVISAHERVVDLVTDIALPPIMPADA